MSTSSYIQISQRWALIGHQHPIYTLALDAERQRLYSAGGDKGVVSWDLMQGSFDRVLHPLPITAYTVCWIAPLALLAVGLRNGEVWLIDVVSQKRQHLLSLHQKPIFALGYSSDKNELLVGSEDGILSVWSLESFACVYQLNLSDTTLRVMAKHPLQDFWVVGDKNGQLIYLDAETYQVIRTEKTHEGSVTALQFSPDGTYLLSAGRDAQLKVLDGHSGQILKGFTPHMQAVYGIAFHPYWPIYATASKDKAIKIWDKDTHRLLKTISMEKGFTSHALSINALLWDQENGHLITAGDDRRILVWNVDIPTLTKEN
jgi:centriolar protein POC1